MERKLEVDDVYESIMGNKLRIHIVNISQNKVFYIGIDEHKNFIVGWENLGSIFLYYKFIKHCDINAHQLFCEDEKCKLF